jgi:prepilin-type N-terminal cleavage/methylation domain-containing protein/prepilin-type processing-associated H-X9-DG protein
MIQLKLKIVNSYHRYNHSSTCASGIIIPKGFTLIELLVVIAIIALLIAILIPVLGRVRKESRALACRSNLHQWGLAFHSYVAANDGRLPTSGWPSVGPVNIYWLLASDHQWQKMLLCPSAQKPSDDSIPPGIEPSETFAPWIGSPFRAWKHFDLDSNDRERIVNGSYGLNNHLAWDVHLDPRFAAAWQVVDVVGASGVPMFFDCAYAWFYTESIGPLYHERAGLGPPPEYKDFIEKPINNLTYWVCMNRHEGGINMVFLDGSVRKIGLKELWTLKWHRWYNTANRWTHAGGVRPEDWPEWMRGFKDF